MQGAVSKGEFAALIGVTPGRVSQYLAEGKISAKALQGVGRNAKIIVEQAKADLRLTLDVGQRLGNGIETRLDAAPIAAPPAAGVSAPTLEFDASASAGTTPPPRLGGLDEQIKQAKLEQIQRANRNAAKAEAESKGALTETEASRQAMTKVASSMLLVFEGGLTDFASAIAAEFKVPQRDVLHLLRREFRKVREAAAKQARKDAAEMPETIETSIEASEIETIN
jgi:hypothetical protein